MQALKVFICHLVLSVTPDAWFIGVLTASHWQLLDLRGSFPSEPVTLQEVEGIQSHGLLGCFHENCIYYKRVIVNK